MFGSLWVKITAWPRKKVCFSFKIKLLEQQLWWVVKLNFWIGKKIFVIFSSSENCKFRARTCGESQHRICNEKTWYVSSSLLFHSSDMSEEHEAPTSWCQPARSCAPHFNSCQVFVQFLFFVINFSSKFSWVYLVSSFLVVSIVGPSGGFWLFHSQNMDQSIPPSSLDFSFTYTGILGVEITSSR
jgi:hypothetical protein